MFRFRATFFLLSKPDCGTGLRFGEIGSMLTSSLSCITGASCGVSPAVFILIALALIVLTDIELGPMPSLERLLKAVFRTSDGPAPFEGELFETATGCLLKSSRLLSDSSPLFAGT